MSRKTSPQLFASDEEIIEMYWQRDPDAIQATDHKYGKLLQNTAYNILSDLQDSEECRNDVYLRVWNAIPSTRPTEFLAFIMQIMRRIAFNRYKEKSRKKRVPSQLTLSLEELQTSLSSGKTVEEEYDAKVLGELITEYVRNLSDRQQYIFVDRYYMAEPVEKIASDLSISSVRTVYREIEKIKQGLKEYLEGNGVYV
jgi:RNA polymerase sigma-70 factor (ECF subfamily)